MTRGGDVLRGREIDLDFCKGILKVRGGASIRLKPANRDNGDEGQDQDPE